MKVPTAADINAMTAELTPAIKHAKMPPWLIAQMRPSILEAKKAIVAGQDPGMAIGVSLYVAFLVGAYAKEHGWQIDLAQAVDAEEVTE